MSSNILILLFLISSVNLDNVTFISLNPLDVFEVIRKMRKNVADLVIPELFESEFRSYQQKLINLEKIINGSEE